MLWCLGMQASASTWIYNVALKLAPILAPEVPAKGSFVGFRGRLGYLADERLLHIVKSHGVDAPTTAELERRAKSIVMSIRDPRDAVASLMLYHDEDFRQALTEVVRSAETCLRLAADQRTLLLRYETGFTDDPATIDRLAGSFGRPVPPAERDRIFAESRRGAIEKLIDQIEELPTAKRIGTDLLDSTTQWHRLHAGRTGEVGKWRRTLTDSQVGRIEARLQDWMAGFGYAPSRPPGLVARLMKLARRPDAA
ncbi:MAG TPA: sulfotransferase domain-containing protein [Acetobacteraceae bacterium]|nr:sulfotransferase domain-containing protein [Acetobacteraceae bacterium]